MANVTVVASISGGRRYCRSIVFTSAAIGYIFFQGATGFAYRKTTDGGATWGSNVVINSATLVGFDVWYDQWTPGDTGTLIHTWYFDVTNNKVFWRSLDTNGDTLGTERTAFTGVSVVAGRGAFVSGTKTRSGYLYAAYDLDAGAEKGFHRSTDSGTTWSASLDANFVEATIDECLLFPASGTGDNNDCWAIYQDASADALTMKMWDSSAAASIESSTVQTMVENVTDGTGQRGFTGAVRFSDGHLIVVSCSERDTATADMQAWDVSAVNSGSLTGITAKTNITTDIDDNYYPAVCIDQDTDTIYVAYNGKRDGSETLGTTTKIYYTKSTDGGSTWTAGDTALDEAAATTNSQVWAPLSGHRFTAVWFPGAGLLTNKVNSVVLYTLVAAKGTFTETGQDITLKVSMPADQGSFTLTGQSVTLTYTPAGGSATITAAVGSFSDTGQTANLLAGHKLTADFASFTDTGQTANLLVGHKLAIGQGSFTIAGQDTSLIYAPVGAFTIAANRGSFTLSGQAVTLARGRFVAVAAGLFAETGQSVSFRLGKVLAGAHGTFIVSGQSAELSFAGILGLHAPAGEFALNGQSVFFSFNYAVLKLDFDAPTDAEAQFSAAGEAGSQLGVAGAAGSSLSVRRAKSNMTADTLA